MSQTIQSPSVTSLTKGLDATRGADPEETAPFPTAALIAAMAAAEPAADPQRDAMLNAHGVLGRILREAPLGTVAQIIETFEEYPYAVQVQLLEDRDRAKLGRFVQLYGGTVTDYDLPQPWDPAAVHSELQMFVNGVPVRAWFLGALVAEGGAA